MGQILLNIFMVFILPVVIGIAVRVAVGKMRKPYIVTSGLILLAVVMWAIVVIVPSHGSEASGIMAMMATCLAVGALVAGLITRICHKTPMQNNEDSEPMKKRKVFIVYGSLLVAVILCVCVYVGIRSNQMKNEMWDYLKANNYAETEIKSVDVKHSFMNALLSYNEWTVDVVFEDEPTSVYKYTVKEGSIVQSGVSGTTDKEDLKHLDVDKLIYGDINRTEEPDEYPPLDIIPGADLDEPGELMESITVEYLGAGQIKKWSVSSELIDDVMEWYADLDYKKVTFKDGESPADGEGQTVYDIEFSDGTSFAYYDCGTEHYIRKDGTWYKVKNPKLPPVGEPV